MAEQFTASDGTLPPGDDDPHLVYIAVGKSIHRWEQMEETLARLALKLSGQSDGIENLPGFGKANGTFVRRISALGQAAQSYFAKHPDQALEGEFGAIVTEVNSLSIERHRIAHGHITMWGELKLPEEKGEFSVDVTMLYRWAPPWYGIEKLRTSPVGLNGAGIEQVSQKFEDLNNRALVFSESLAG